MHLSVLSAKHSAGHGPRVTGVKGRRRAGVATGVVIKAAELGLFGPIPSEKTMNGSELLNHAFDEMHHRLRQVRSYSLLDRDGSKTTVHAALTTKGDELTESNPLNQKTLSLVADTSDDGTLFP
jgi:hypothetical protein